MQQLMKSTLTILFSSLLFLSGCSLFFDREPRETPEPALPELTAKGANTFGCLVDGEVWLPESDNWTEPRLWSSYSSGVLILDANKVSAVDSLHQIIGIKLLNVWEPDTFYLGHGERDAPLEANNAGFYSLTPPYGDYITLGNESSPESGTVIITSMDTAYTSGNRHIAGTFKFTGIEDPLYSNGGQVIQVTDGRFDIALP